MKLTRKVYLIGRKPKKKLRGFLQLMDTLLNTIPNPIYYKDDQGVYQGCNKMFAKQVLGLTRDRIIGKRPQELTDAMPSDLAAVYQREEHIMLDKAGFHTFEAPVQCADGQRRDFLFSLAPVLDHEGRPDGSVAVLADLTEKKPRRPAPHPKGKTGRCAGNRRRRLPRIQPAPAGHFRLYGADGHEVGRPRSPTLYRQARAPGKSSGPTCRRRP
jgi:PAS domain S-box-containing protein